MELINKVNKVTKVTITDLPPEIHCHIYKYIQSPIDKFNFATSSVIFYNSIDINEVIHNMRMKSIVRQINSIEYECDEPNSLYANQSSFREIGNRKVTYTFWKCKVEYDIGLYRQKDFADYLYCFIDGITEFKNNCGRSPIIASSNFRRIKTNLYTLNTARKCIIDWAHNRAGNLTIIEIFNNNSLKKKSYYIYK